MHYVLTFLGGMVLGAICLRWIQAELRSRRKPDAGRRTRQRRTAGRPVSNEQRMRNNGWIPGKGQQVVSFLDAAHAARRKGVSAEELDDMQDDKTMPF